MNGRKTASTITDADLDALHAELNRLTAELTALRAVARGYCPACGRGDAAPSVTDWEQQKQRADQAEATITRVRAIAGWAINSWSDLSPQKVLAALGETATPAATGAASCPRTTPDNPTSSDTAIIDRPFRSHRTPKEPTR